jgi:SHS2 domain-containing protein
MADKEITSDCSTKNIDKRGHFRVIEHPADIGISICAPGLEKAFEIAAKGLFSIICNIDKVKPQNEKKLQVLCNAEMGIEGLLVLWLEKLIYLHEVNKILLSEFKVEPITTRNLKNTKGGGRYVLQAIAYGEKIDPFIHELRLAVKAVTYHNLSLKKDGESGNWLGTVIFDV